jgi:ADP-ribose pyrophosphatase
MKIFRGRIVTLDVEAVELPNGTRTVFEVVRHPGGAAIVALDAAQRVCLLRQYRHAMGGWLWELPAGKIDHGEPPLQTAQRELQEEAGLQAARWDELGSVVSSPAVFTERIHLYLARGLVAAPASPGDEEVIEVHWLPFAEALAQALDGAIGDAKTLAGLVRAERWLRGGG